MAMTKGRMEWIVGLMFTAGLTLLGVYTILLSDVSLGGTKRYLVDFEEVTPARKKAAPKKKEEAEA